MTSGAQWSSAVQAVQIVICFIVNKDSPYLAEHESDQRQCANPPVHPRLVLSRLNLVHFHSSEFEDLQRMASQEASSAMLNCASFHFVVTPSLQKYFP